MLNIVPDHYTFYQSMLQPIDGLKVVVNVGFENLLNCGLVSCVLLLLPGTVIVDLFII